MHVFANLVTFSGSCMTCMFFIVKLSVESTILRKMSLYTPIQASYVSGKECDNYTRNLLS